MLRLCLLPIVFLASSCEADGPKRTTQPDVQPRLVTAAQSTSLEFPLHFDAADAPTGYIKVGSGEGRGESAEHLIDALVLCSPDLAWVEKTSHSTAVIMPSHENAIWEGAKGSRPSDEAIIACIKQSTDQPFFYRKLAKGTDTFWQN